MVTSSSNFKFPLLPLLFALSLTLNIIQLVSHPLFPQEFVAFPTAQISGPLAAPKNQPLVFSVLISDPSPAPSLLSVFYAPVTDKQQDNWTLASQSTVKAGLVQTVSISFPSSGVYYVMVNVNDKQDQNRTSCTGNPTYTPTQLSGLNLKSCGANSYLKITIQ